MQYSLSINAYRLNFDVRSPKLLEQVPSERAMRRLSSRAVPRWKPMRLS